MALSLLQQTLFNGGVLMAVLLAILGAVILFISTLVKMSPLSIVSSIFSKSPGRLSLPFDGRLSDTTRFTESDQVLDLKRARLWHKFCQFAPGPSISSTYSFPLITASIFKNVVASDAFPLSILGIVHARQEIEQFLPMTDATGAYDYVVSCTAARLVETGAECDVTLEVFAPLNGGKLMNRTVMTCISTDAKKAKKARKARKVLTEKEKEAKGALSPCVSSHSFVDSIAKDHSVRYTAVSGDSNLIHHPTYCKLMGMSKPIMHGMYSLGRAVAAVEEKYKLAGVKEMKISAAWKLPLPVGCEATFSYGELKDVSKTEHAGSVDSKAYKKHVEFLVTRESRGSVLPHLRGVVSF